MPINEDQTLTVQDPRNFDGNSYQVAERAIQQLAGIIAVAQSAVEPTDLMLRSAELDRQLVDGADRERMAAAALLWPKSPPGTQTGSGCGATGRNPEGSYGTGNGRRLRP